MDDNLIFLNNMNYPISSLVTNTSTETDGIQGPGLGQAYNMGRVKLVMFLRICNLHTSCISKHQISHNVMLQGATLTNGNEDHVNEEVDSSEDENTDKGKLNRYFILAQKNSYSTQTNFDHILGCLQEGSCVIYIVCVCLHMVVFNTYCVVFFFFLCALCYQFLWIVHF